MTTMAVVSTAAVITLLVASSVTAFVSPNSNRHVAIPYTGTMVTPTSLIAATLEQPPTRNMNGTTTTTTTSNDDDNDFYDDLRQQMPVVEKDTVPDNDRTTLDVRIHGEWFDLTGWRKAHPAGEHWIDWYDGRDATEVMDAFHSEKGRKMYKKLPKSKPLSKVEVLQAQAEKDTPTQIAFRKLRDDLEKDGWWIRDKKQEYTLLGIWGTLVGVAALVGRSVPMLSTFLLGLSMTAAGWLGHDYIHGVDKYTDKLRNFAAVAAGLLPVWWSDKHNKHHALTNEVGCDEDIATDPFLYSSVPSPENDNPLRRIQHWIFYIPFSFLFALWRIDSVKVAISSVKEGRPGSKPGLYSLIIHYSWLFALFPIKVWLPAIFFSGLLSALIVTPTHQSEEMFTEYQSDWVTAQYQSTRNAVATNPFSEWLWGGMQYQLEHHLFPSMPRSKYPQLKTILQKFAIDNKIPGGYRESGEFEILKMNWDLYRRVALAPAVVGAPSSRGYVGQQGGILDSDNSPAASYQQLNKKKHKKNKKKKTSSKHSWFGFLGKNNKDGGSSSLASSSGSRCPIPGF